MDQLLTRLSTPAQVKALFDILLPAEKDALGLRRDFRGRIIIDISRQLLSGSLGLEKNWKLPVTVEIPTYPPPPLGEPWPTETKWQDVTSEQPAETNLPEDFVLHLFNAACQHPWFVEQMVGYYGVVPELEIPGVENLQSPANLA